MFNYDPDDDGTLWPEPEFRKAYLKELIFDETGETVTCDWCDEEIIYKDGIYQCPGCGRTFTYQELYDYTGGDVHCMNN